jgi:sugar lactone lactonase YvrE
MRTVIFAVVAIACLVGYLLFWPVPIEPVAWTPKPAPAAEGVYAPNEALKNIEKIATGYGHGPEGIAIDAPGRIYAGFDDGRVAMFSADGKSSTPMGNTRGRPLGITFGPNGGLIVADAIKGLLLIGSAEFQQTLAVAAEGTPFRFADDVDNSRLDKNVYFTDASARFSIDNTMADFLEHGHSGRLLRYDVANDKVDVLMKDLHFPNGVAVGPDDAYVLVNETAEYRIWRYWLKGEKAGTAEIFLDNLPGLPDNLSFNNRDRFWVALYAPRSDDLDKLLPQPDIRKIVYRIPDFLRPKPALRAWVLGLDLDGKVVANLQYAGSDAYAPITSVEQSGEWLYFGSLTYPAIGRIRLKDALAAAGASAQ